MRRFVVGALWTLVACVDPGAKLDAFHRRKLAAQMQDAGRDDSQQDSGKVARLPTPDQIEGSYLYVVSTVLAPRKPILSYLEVKAAKMGERLELTMRDRPISAEDRQTSVGDFGPWRVSFVEADGSYMTESLRIVTPGEADAVQPGVESESNLVFSGRVPVHLEPDQRIDFWCGKADGMLLRPIEQPLDGSTFTVMRIVDPDDYPTPVINCAMDPAETL